MFVCANRFAKEQVIAVTLKGLPLPCPLNALYRAIPVRVGKFGRAIAHKMVTSKRGRLCKEELVAAIRRQLSGNGPGLNRPCQLTYSIVAPDRRPRDVDCYEKQLLDCLQLSGVVADDVHIKQISKEMMPYTKRPGWIDLQLIELPA